LLDLSAKLHSLLAEPFELPKKRDEEDRNLFGRLHMRIVSAALNKDEFGAG
jgi:hypothetical protein